MSLSDSPQTFRVAVLSVVKHDYVARAVAAHPRLRLAVVADDPDRPHWVHERNVQFAEEFGIPYVRDVERALADYGGQIAVVSSEAERHCDLSVRAANAGLHVVQDKPMSTRLSECERLVEAIERSGVKFMMWNRNLLPSLKDARAAIEERAIGKPYAFHVDFHFAKVAGPPAIRRLIGSRPRSPPIPTAPTEASAESRWVS
jgi:predicted dehydrogenase